MASKTKKNGAKKEAASIVASTDESPKVLSQKEKAARHHSKMISSGKSMTRWLAKNEPDVLKSVLEELGV